MAPQKASLGMTPVEFPAWANSVVHYSITCKWPTDKGTTFVHLLCEEEVPTCVDARAHSGLGNMSMNDMIKLVESIVVGPECVVSASLKFFNYNQEIGDSVSI